MLIQFVRPDRRELWFDHLRDFAAGCHDYDGNRRPKTKIYIANNLSIWMGIKTLTHELLHCLNWEWMDRWLDNL